jgi:hypothetical protein
MLHRRTSFVLGILAALMLAMPLAAHASADTKNSKPTVTTIDLQSPTSLSGKELKPGTYRITMDDAKLTVEQNGKVIAEAAAQWKDEPSKPAYSSVVRGESGIREIHLRGKTRYIAIAD